MNVMSTELSTIGPLCQAAIVTFEPFTMAVRLLQYGLLLSAAVKISASLAKAFFTFNGLTATKRHHPTVQKLAAKYQLAPTNLTVINDTQLIAFSSIVPLISNGIYLSVGACRRLSPRQLEAVFLHELHHWRHKDPLTQLGLKIITEICFFIPSIRDVLNHWQLRAELKADAFVVTQLGSAQPLQKALTNWLKHTNPNSTPAWAIAFAETQLSQRIGALNQKPGNQSWWSTKTSWPALGRLLISLAVITGLVAIQTSRWSQAKAQLIIPTSAQCNQAWQNGAMQSSIFTVMSHQ